ncbi:MAG: 50S ribosomal protein L10 [Bacillota bacterium]|jgi:Ribosomal protein L10|nr:50S ribosomal protein L10 [Bacillota bacterium]
MCSPEEVIEVPKPEKVAAVAKLQEDLAASQAVFVTDFRGLTVAQLTKLRRKLREAGAEYRVVKNTLARRAADEVGASALNPLLVGPTGMAFAKKDPVATAKVLNEFVKETKIFQVRGGLLQGKLLTPEGVQALADLPPREVLLAQVLGGLQAPISGLLFVLQGTLRKLVYVLDAVREKKAAAS